MATAFDRDIKLDFKSMDIDEHAVKRAKERFKRKDREDALNYFRSLLGNSKYMGESTCEFGNKAHMFVAPNKTAIYVTLDLHTIVTAYKIEEKPYIVYSDKNTNQGNDENPLQNKLIKLYTVEFKRYDRMEKKMERQHIETKLKLEIEMLENKLMLMKARSEKNKSKYQKLIDEIAIQIKDSEDALVQIQSDKRKISKALATLLSE